MPLHLHVHVLRNLVGYIMRESNEFQEIGSFKNSIDNEVQIFHLDCSYNSFHIGHTN